LTSDSGFVASHPPIPRPALEFVPLATAVSAPPIWSSRPPTSRWKG